MSCKAQASAVPGVICSYGRAPNHGPSRQSSSTSSDGCETAGGCGSPSAGAVVVVAGTVLALLLSASGPRVVPVQRPADHRASASSRSRCSSACCCYGLVWPLRRRVTDAQVALYLEECDPTLEAAIISAVEATTPAAAPAHSPRLVEKLVEQAIEQCRALDDGRAIERDVGAAARGDAGRASRAIAALIIAFGPAYLRHGLSALLVVYAQRRGVEPVQHRSHARQHEGAARRRSDRQARKLVGFTSNDVSVMMRTAADAPFERVPLIAGARAGHVRGHAVPPRKDHRVLRRVERRRTRRTFTLTVVDLPTGRAARASSTASPPTPSLAAAQGRSGGDVAAHPRHRGRCCTSRRR